MGSRGLEVAEGFSGRVPEGDEGSNMVAYLEERVSRGQWRRFADT